MPMKAIHTYASTSAPLQTRSEYPVDMRGRPPVQIISPELEQALNECFEQGGKAIVLFNRRGYAPSVECPGWRNN